MRIIVAKNAGFCMGVRRAVEMALDAPAKYDAPIYTYGPLIHNPQVLALFAEKGVTVLKEIPTQGHGTVLVRAHGVPPETKLALKQAGFTVIDATCPKVVKVQAIIRRYARKGYAVIIVGDNDHPEVVGLHGFAGDRGHIVASLDQLVALPVFDRAIIVAQTTQNQAQYREIKAWAAKERPKYMVFDTICDSTEKRQAEIRELAKEVDALVVVGGKSSGNSRRLAEIASAEGKPVYFVETEEELDSQALSSIQTLGIAAGASTPAWIIKRVIRSAEQASLRYGRDWRSTLLGLQRLLSLTNIYVALGAGSLAFAAGALQGLPYSPSALAAAILYVLSMHILNHLTGLAEDRYNDPERERLYRSRKTMLTAMAIIAGAVGLVAAYSIGWVAFWALLAMSILGLSYNLRLIPNRLAPRGKIRRIRDIPGSKTILITLAWGMVTAVLPSLTGTHERQFMGSGVALLITVGLVFSRTAFFDILDMHGDRIVGKETIPIILGLRRSFRLLKIVLIGVAILLPVAAGLGWVRPTAVVLALCPLLLLAVVVRFQRGNLLPGIRLEFGVESLLLLSGVLIWVQKLLGWQ
jgi:4-hydroxy-3-methylbut-2-enyl diphosphate reductase